MIVPENGQKSNHQCDFTLTIPENGHKLSFMSTICKTKTVHLEFDPRRYSEKVKNLILARASEWNCSPQVAVRRLLERHVSAKVQGGLKKS